MHTWTIPCSRIHSNTVRVIFFFVPRLIQQNSFSVVVLILDNTLRVRILFTTWSDYWPLSFQPMLNCAEVASLFSHPLASFLSTEPPFPSEPDTLEVPYHTSIDLKADGSPDQTFRNHQFLTGREAGGIKPVFGLTAYVFPVFCFWSYCPCHDSAILIRTATIGYARAPDFEVHSPNACSTEERIAYALLNRKVLRDACDKENIDLRVAKDIVEVGVRREQQLSKQEMEKMERKQLSKLWLTSHGVSTCGSWRNRQYFMS